MPSIGDTHEPGQLFSLQSVQRIGKTKTLFHPALSAVRLRRRPLLARGDGGSPSTRRQYAAVACSKAWRGNAWPGHAA